MLPPCGVLIADDEPAVREVLNIGMRREGFNVWLAADGQAALNVYRRHCEAINVALLDVCMPVLNGPQTLVALKELAPNIPCCFMSGNLGVYTEAELRDFGAAGVFLKPFHLAELARVLRDLVGGTGAGVEARARQAIAAPTTTTGAGVAAFTTGTSTQACRPAGAIPLDARNGVSRAGGHEILKTASGD